MDGHLTVTQTILCILFGHCHDSYFTLSRFPSNLLGDNHRKFSLSYYYYYYYHLTAS